MNMLKAIGKACVSLMAWRSANAIREAVYQHGPDVLSSTICKRRVFSRGG